MKIFQLKKKQALKMDLNLAWSYFSNPANLMKITPSNLQMTITSEIPPKMYRGAIITYTIKPILGIPINWITEITHVKEQQEFIDEQRFGPYKFWHHRHTFKEVKKGVEIGDLVHYGLPFGPLSSMMNSLSIRSQLEKIFGFRRKILADQFGEIDLADKERT